MKKKILIFTVIAFMGCIALVALPKIEGGPELIIRCKNIGCDGPYWGFCTLEYSKSHPWEVVAATCAPVGDPVWYDCCGVEWFVLPPPE